MMAKILLVDDDESIRITLAVLLEEDGFAVDVADSCATALACAANDAASYDLVLLDAHLRDGLGTSILPLLRARQPAARVILITGGVSDSDYVCPGLDAVLSKGIACADLLARVHAELEEATRRRSCA